MTGRSILLQLQQQNESCRRVFCRSAVQPDTDVSQLPTADCSCRSRETAKGTLSTFVSTDVLSVRPSVCQSCYAELGLLQCCNEIMMTISKQAAALWESCFVNRCRRVHCKYSLAINQPALPLDFIAK